MAQDKEMFYMGRRISQSGKLVHAFLENGSNEKDGFVFYPKAKASSFHGLEIGALYDLTKGLPLLWSKIKIGSIDEEKKIQWATESRTDIEYNSQKSKIPDKELIDLINQISKHVSMMSHQKKAAFLSWLIKRIM